MRILKDSVTLKRENGAVVVDEVNNYYIEGEEGVDGYERLSLVNVVQGNVKRIFDFASVDAIPAGEGELAVSYENTGEALIKWWDIRIAGEIWANSSGALFSVDEVIRLAVDREGLFVYTFKIEHPTITLPYTLDIHINVLGGDVFVIQKVIEKYGASITDRTGAFTIADRVFYRSIIARD